MTPITVIVDVLSAHFGGGGAVVLQQLEAIERLDDDVRLRVLAGPWNADALRHQLRSPVTTIDVRDGVPRVAWEQAVLPWREHAGDVLYCPGNTVPLLPTRLPLVLALQNPNLFGAGRDVAHNQRWYRRTRVALAHASARRADAIVVVSHALRDEVAADLPRLAPKLTVIPCGAPTLPAPGPTPSALTPVPRRFVVSIANDAPHKQIDATVLAYARAFADASEEHVPSLVLAGFIPEHRRANQRASVAPHLRDKLRYLGPVTDRRDISWLLHHAQGYVSSSSLESFGLVTLEAGSAGCPLVLTDIPAHREVAGNHARYVPVGDLAAMATALHEVATSEHVDRTPWTWPISWDDHARRLVEVLRSTAARARSAERRVHQS